MLLSWVRTALVHGRRYEASAREGGPGAGTLLWVIKPESFPDWDSYSVYPRRDGSTRQLIEDHAWNMREIGRELHRRQQAEAERQGSPPPPTPRAPAPRTPAPTPMMNVLTNTSGSAAAGLYVGLSAGHALTAQYAREAAQQEAWTAADALQAKVDELTARVTTFEGPS